ncbi:MAG TPA: glycoside hydrolase family 2 TIM barrel-domain containing protein, partial [Chitinophagaceae bacterium]|nr:glycoside hydrolase family 2 TIM barrel-domain containing protein [Chitinophagaceae bacterium]
LIRKYFFIIITLLLAFININAQNNRQRLLMDFNWRFSQTDTIGADKTSFNDTKWRTLNLPHDWSIENTFIEDAPTGGRGGYLPTGIGWYRKHFVLPKSVIKNNIWIEFEGVYQNSDVWINGHHIGHYPNGYMSFWYDLTPYIKSGENILAVCVDNSLQPNSRWYSGSGIYRHVWLNIADPVHVAQWGTYITTPAVDSTSATVDIKTKIENNSTVSKNVVLQSIVFNEKGNEVARAESPFSLASKTEAEWEQKITVSSPALWSLETPNMYSLQTIILDNGKILDEVTSSFGIREIKYDVNKGFFLNGKHIKMNGVCLHHDAGSVGAAVPEAMWMRRLKILKEMGCNAIRTSHNPPAPEFLDLCDKMGFLVMDEAFDVWESGKVKNDYHLYFDEWWQRDATGQIQRDRNHPSVVIWSAGNEIPDQKNDKGIELLKALLAVYHKEDPTRPVTTANDDIAADNGATKLAFMQEEDIVGYNYVDRWHERRELFYSIDRHDHPDWKMTGTESVSIGGVRGNYYGGNFFSVDSSVIRPAYMAGVIRAEQLWKFVSLHDYVIGDFMWTGIDYLGEARWPNKNSSSGVIDLCGFPKDGYYFYQSQWTKKPMIHLFPHWNWKGKEGQVIQVMAYTNCDSVELFLNGRSFGIKALEFPREGNSGAWNRYDRPPVNATTGDLHLMWDVPYEPGTLKAVGRKNGKIVVAEEIHTAGAPAAIRLSVDRDTINADQRDVTHIKVEVIDENGYLVPDANNRVQLKIEGEGNLIGFDNGNPADHTSMKSSERRTFNGLALAVVQSGNQSGTIRVEANSPLIEGASIEITTQKVETPLATVEDIKK